MAPAEPNVDYYAVLEVSNIATIEEVSRSYRRLAKIRHPDKNPNHDSTTEFQLLQNAYETISDPTKRRAYDLRWPCISDMLRTQQASEKRQAEAARAKKEHAAEARAKKQEEDAGRQERLRGLEWARRRYEGDAFELDRMIRKLKADLKRLKGLDDEDVRKERERNGWWAYLASPIYGRVTETEEQKRERDKARLDRSACERIKGSELAEKEARLQKLQDELRDVNGRIAAEKKKMEDEKKRVEEEARARRVKMEQEARDRVMREARERMVRAQKEQAERAAKEAREAQASREAQERAWVAAEAERRRREAEERAQALQRAEESARRARKARDDRSRGGAKGSCRHDRFWPKVDGSQLCGKCFAVQNRFAFQCPGCRMVACASCRQSLRGRERKSGIFPGRRYGFAGSGDYDCEIPSYDWD